MNPNPKAFQAYLKDPKMGTKPEKMKLMNQYHAHVHAQSGGGGKIKSMKGCGALIKSIHQKGGSWSDFTGWVKGAANTVANGTKKAANAVANGAKSAGNFVYNKGIKPGWDYAKNKPLTTIGHIANAAAFIPSPFSGALRTAGTAATTVGRLTGTGAGKKLMRFD
jgi:hypothetical protein